ncbi:hypothetical protein M3P21_12585 [Ruegeria sp. 2012CJ41-6]|uniref:Uncharacterized protein n=1 Tax=Ruegeria spongiae TaxID=2942209 RepID=A0ABT0Q3J6_9RHOB|nr:hypothetical protein [Ruegeria spongiae]MCL6284362.1 hypothetical protein [Ruegeria spongiae]
MSTSTPHPPVSFLRRVAMALPFGAGIVRQIDAGTLDRGAAKAWGLVAAGVAIWACSTALFGVPGFYIPALIMVPVIWAILLIITLG